MTNRTTAHPRVGVSVRFRTPDTVAGTNRTPNRTLLAGIDRGTGHRAGQQATGHPPRSRTGHLQRLRPPSARASIRKRRWDHSWLSSVAVTDPDGPRSVLLVARLSSVCDTVAGSGTGP